MTRRYNFRQFFCFILAFLGAMVLLECRRLHLISNFSTVLLPSWSLHYPTSTCNFAIITRLVFFIFFTILNDEQPLHTALPAQFRSIRRTRHPSQFQELLFNSSLTQLNNFPVRLPPIWLKCGMNCQTRLLLVLTLISLKQKSTPSW